MNKRSTSTSRPPWTTSALAMNRPAAWATRRGLPTDGVGGATGRCVALPLTRVSKKKNSNLVWICELRPLCSLYDCDHYDYCRDYDYFVCGKREIRRMERPLQKMELASGDLLGPPEPSVQSVGSFGRP